MMGGLRKRGCDFAMHWQRALWNIAKAIKINIASFYGDLKIAFDSAVRPFIAEENCSDELIATLCSKYHITDNMYIEFRELLEVTCLEKVEVPKELGMVSSLLLSGSWLSHERSASIIKTSSGTNAGTCLADMFFIFLMNKLSKRIDLALFERDLIEHFRIPHINSILYPKGISNIDICPESGPTYIDDGVINIFPSSASTLVEDISMAAKLFIDISMQFLFTLNLAKGKSEFIFKFAGKNIASCRARLFSSNSPCIIVSSQSLGSVSICVSSLGKFLGSKFDHHAKMECEISHRTASGLVALKKQHTLFASRKLSSSAKLLLVSSKIFSRIFYCAGIWHHLSDHSQMFIDHSYMASLRVATHSRTHSDPSSRIHNSQVLVRAGKPSAFHYCHFLRLKYFLRIFQYVPEYVRWILHVEFALAKDSSWLSQIHSDLFSLIAEFGAMLPLASPMADPLQWADFILFDNKIILYNAIHNILSLTEYDPSVAISSFPCSVEQTEHSCELCCWFGSSRLQLHGHMWAAHRVRNPIHAKLHSNRCPSCNVCFSFRMDIVRHVKRSLHCYNYIMDNVSDIDVDKLGKLNAELACQDKAVRKSGASILGPRKPSYFSPTIASMDVDRSTGGTSIGDPIF